MMQDRFEIYIKSKVTKSPENFEGKKEVWEKIRTTQPTIKHRKKYTFFKYAAVIVLLLSVGAILLFQKNDINPNKESYFKSVSNELEEVEILFATEIESKYTELENFPNIDKQYFKVFFMELEFLDEQYDEYKTELVESGFHETVIEAMIDNQKMKLQVLSKLLTEIKKVKSYETKSKQVHI